MIPSTLDNAFDPWAVLARYRERYDIEDRLGVLHHLEKTIDRRRGKMRALQRRANWLSEELEETKRLAQIAEDEISGSLQAGGLLIQEILDQIRIEFGEAWSPAPVTGYRVWEWNGNALKGAKVAWRRPWLSAECLSDIPGDDVPHSEERCGKPACGIYATKELGPFYELYGESLFDEAVVGVVALSGKVVEHERGYRARHARVVAAVARHSDRGLVATDSEQLTQLFDHPRDALATHGSLRQPGSGAEEELLRRWKETEEWI